MGLFLCCHEQVKKILEAFLEMLGAQNTQEKENILCINVFRYLPKEKEETNFLQEESGNRPSERQGKALNKIGNKSRLIEALCWPSVSKGKRGNCS